MDTQHYIVARAGSRWSVSFHGTQEGPFSTKEAALDAAIAAATLASKDGRQVAVLVQDIESNFHTAWTSGGEGADEALSSSA